MFGIQFLHLSATLWYFCMLTSFLKNGLGKLPWVFFISNLEAKLSIISITVPGLATDLSCGVWTEDKQLAFCVVVHLYVYVYKQQFLSKFDKVETDFSIFDLHPLLYYQNVAHHFPLKSFYSEMPFYSKYFVLLYSRDVVSTLCNQMNFHYDIVLIIMVAYHNHIYIYVSTYACIYVCTEIFHYVRIKF